jgi:hexosaminidase
MRTAAYHYGIDPLSGPAAQLNAEQRSRILGGEACMWVEYASDETIDSRLWPRLAVIAERLWSPEQITDVAWMYARLEPVSRQLEWTGVRHRANYEPMLDRLAGGRPAEPLRTLADAVEALGIDGRRGEKKTSLLDLNRLADAARPESEPVRQLELSATRVIVNESFGYDHAGLRAAFTAWAQNDERLQPLFESNPLLGELAPISKNLASAGKIGLEALDSWESGKPVSDSWVTQAWRELDRTAKPSAELVLAAVRPVRILVEAVSQNAKPNSGRPAEKH